MPFSRPTYTNLKQQVAAAIQAAVPQLLRVSNFKIIGQVIVDMVQGLYGYLDWIALQCTPFTATDPIFILAWGALKNLFLKNAVAAGGQMTVTGAQPNTLIPVGTLINRETDGVEYATTTAATVGSGGTIVLTIQATVPAAAGTLVIGQTMAFASAISGLPLTGTITATTTPGSDIENVLTSFKPRMLAAYASPPQGGDATDYIQWALAVSGVTRAWVTPNGMGTGTVIVYAMLDNSEADFNGFPQGSNGVSQYDMGYGGTPRSTVATGDQLTIANAISIYQPVTALVFVCAPVSTPVNFTIAGLASAGSIVQANVAAAISGVFLRLGGPGGSLDINRNVKGSIELSDIESAIAAIAGTEGFVITSPSANLIMTAGELPVLATITWT